MSNSYYEIRAEVLDWLDLVEMDGTTPARYNKAIARAINNASQQLNKGPVLPNFQKTVGLDYIFPADLDPPETENPDLGYYIETENWAAATIPDWLLTGTNITASNPYTVDGVPYASQIGIAFNAGSRTRHEFSIPLGDTVSGCYYSQTVNVSLLREYTVTASVDVLEATLHVDQVQDVDAYPMITVVAPGGQPITITTQGVERDWPADGFTGLRAPSLTFRVDANPGAAIDALIPVEIRVGWNVAGVEIADPALTDPFIADFAVINVTLAESEVSIADEKIRGATLPDDCLHVRGIRLDDSPPLTQSDGVGLLSGQYFRRVGNIIEFGIPIDRDNLPVGRLTYTPKLPLIDIDNPPTTEHDGIAEFYWYYLYGALAMTCAYLFDEQKRMQYQADQDKAYAQIVLQRKQWQRQSERPYVVRRV